MRQQWASLPAEAQELIRLLLAGLAPEGTTPDNPDIFNRLVALQARMDTVAAPAELVDGLPVQGKGISLFRRHRVKRHG